MHWWILKFLLSVDDGEIELIFRISCRKYQVVFIVVFLDFFFCPFWMKIFMRGKVECFS